LARSPTTSPGPSGPGFTPPAPCAGTRPSESGAFTRGRGDRLAGSGAFSNRCSPQSSPGNHSSVPTGLTGVLAATWCLGVLASWRLGVLASWRHCVCVRMSFGSGRRAGAIQAPPAPTRRASDERGQPGPSGPGKAPPEMQRRPGGTRETPPRPAPSSIQPLIPPAESAWHFTPPPGRGPDYPAPLPVAAAGPPDLASPPATLFGSLRESLPARSGRAPRQAASERRQAQRAAGEPQRSAGAKRLGPLPTTSPGPSGPGFTPPAPCAGTRPSESGVFTRGRGDRLAGSGAFSSRYSPQSSPGNHSSVPTGFTGVLAPIPASELAGYFQSSLAGLLTAGSCQLSAVSCQLSAISHGC